MKFKLIRDGRTLNALAKKYGFEYDKHYKYITNCPFDAETDIIAAGYRLKYFSGCFKPYLIKLI